MIRAGGKIQITGGDDPVEGDPNDIFNFTGSSVLIYGSALLETWGENSRIVVDGPNEISVLTPTHFNEIDDFIFFSGYSFSLFCFSFFSTTQ